ncbi:hypothetical protein DEO72_LG7g582 [Vigna unguiculata]|uniref:Uncharacterized protein n=1 Tax=Vigna unguiculata TaxID=3917 RepID=A0A4D6MFQ5_VIGUN|nr:hypothetical protein DEO72_LG7g582 [Vigna unguiculata]
MQPLVQRFPSRTTTDFGPPPHRLAIKLVVLVAPPFPASISPFVRFFFSFLIQLYHFFAFFSSETTNPNGGHHETINALSRANHHFKPHLRRLDPNIIAIERHHRKVWTKQATKVTATRKKFWRRAKAVVADLTEETRSRHAKLLHCAATNKTDAPPP